MTNRLIDIFQLLKNTITAEFKKLTAQKIVPRYLAIFVTSELIIVSLLAFYNYKLSELSDPVQTLEEFHSLLFTTGFTLVFIFAGSQQICREFENGVIKNITLTGIPLPVYLFSRLIGFVFMLLAYLLITYVVGLILVYGLFSNSFNIDHIWRGLPINALNIVHTIFVVILAASFAKVTIKSIRYLLFYFIGFEKIFINALISLKALLNIPEWIVTLASNSPLHVLENIQNTYNPGDMAINIFLYSVFIVLYGITIWAINRKFQLGLLNK